MRVEVVADRAVDRVADGHRVLHAGAAQVDDAVAQPQQLVDRRLLVDRERRRGRLGQRLGLGDLELDLAGLELRVDVALLAPHDRAGRGDDVLGAQPLGERVGVGGGLGVEDELDDPGAVAQVDEDQPAVVAAAVHPAGHAHGRVDVAGAQLAGPRVAVEVRARGPHRALPPRMWCITVSGSTVFCSPISMSLREVPSSPRIATKRAPARSACLSWPFSERPPSSSRAE